MLSEEEILRRLSSELKPSRFAHSLGVRDTAVELARIYGCDEDKCRLAGILHDCAKYMSLEQMMDIIQKGGIELYPHEDEYEPLLHAPAGAALAKLSYGVNDEQILSAIRKHTTGKDMDLLEAIIFVADMIEPTRTYIPGCDELRALARNDIFAAVEKCKQMTKEYCESQGHRVFSI